MRRTRHHGTVIALDPLVAVPGSGRPEPPTDLLAREAEVWRDVTSAMPAGWFGRESHALLRAYCRHAATAEVANKKLVAALAKPATKDALAAADKLSKLHARESAAMCAVAYQLRLSPKSRIAKLAAGNARAASPARRPWEDDE